MCNTAKQVIVSQEHKNQIQTQQIDTAHRLEMILIVCGNEIRSAISYFKQCLRVLIYLSYSSISGIMAPDAQQTIHICQIDIT